MDIDKTFDAVIATRDMQDAVQQERNILYPQFLKLIILGTQNKDRELIKRPIKRRHFLVKTKHCPICSRLLDKKLQCYGDYKFTKETLKSVGLNWDIGSDSSKLWINYFACVCGYQFPDELCSDGLGPSIIGY